MKASVVTAAIAAMLSCPGAIVHAQKPPTRAAVEKATAALAAGRRAEAAAIFEELGERDKSVYALLQLARIRSQDGDAAGALAALGRARALAPNSEEVVSAFAQVSLAARAINPAIAALDALTRMCPTVAAHQYLLGVALMQAGDMISAVDALRRADRLEPDRPLTLIALGLALNNRKMFSEAAEPLARAVALGPENLEALAALAESEEGLGQAEAAETRARQVLASAPRHATANLVLGLVLLRAGRYQEAREALVRAAEADPLAPRPEYQLSLVYARLGDAASSQEHRDLYDRKLREVEARVQQLRSQASLPAPGRLPQ